ncbi:MAG: hypothetical protein HY912_02845 [Desulfomonile tiedjei]|uniref:Uncharacterized protein n=1 Tax=Desulfomonile tiedjei TaxID=2358 RepID=A0A9D6V0G1_9BACT|nr:hypothetical protein [Desulfomonile tiedjei]
MAIRDIETLVPCVMLPHTDDFSAYEPTENRPEDDFSRWLISHREEMKNFVCSSSSYKDEAFCAR